MDWGQIATVGLGYLIAGAVKGATGLGYSTTALPILTFGIGLRAAMPLVLIPSMASNFAIMLSAGHFWQTVRQFALLYVSLVPGLALGLAMLLYVDQDLAAGMLGLVLVTYAIFTFCQPNLVLPVRLHGPLQIPVGLMNGFINGLTGSQIMPLAPFMLSLRLDPNRFVQAINIAFTLSSLVMMLGLSRSGLLTWNGLAISVAGIGPTLVGAWLGGRLRQRMPAAGFRRLVLCALFVLGLLLASRLFGHS